MKDYYQILGLDQSASATQIQAAYRKLVHKFHPDKNDGDEFFTAMFVEVQQAYKILGSLASKSAYDRLLMAYKIRLRNQSPSSAQQAAYSRATGQSRNEATRTAHQTKPEKKVNSFKIIGYSSTLMLALLIVVFSFVYGGEGFFFSAVFSGSLSTFGMCVYDWKTNPRYDMEYSKLFVSPIIALLIFYLYVGGHVLSDNESTAVATNPLPKTARESALETASEYASTTNNPDSRIPKGKGIESRYKGNSLKNGSSPYDDCFGRGQYDGASWIEFENGTRRDAVVCLVETWSGGVVRNEYIQANANFTMIKVPSGTYWIKTYYGQNWNPHKRSACGDLGGFDSFESYTKSDDVTDRLQIDNSGGYYSTYQITLHVVEDGNMQQEEVMESTFFE